MENKRTSLSHSSALNGLISTSDVASLAGVERSVVSMWKRRKRDSEFPFPEPQARHGSTDYFSVDAISAWFTHTGMGNNPRASQDAYSYSALELMGDAEELQPIIEALLLLRSKSESPLAAHPDFLISAADDVDPDDEFLFSEVHSTTVKLAGGSSAVPLESLTTFVNNLYDNAFSTSHSLRVLHQRERNRNLHARARYMSPELAEFVADFMAAVALREGRFELPPAHIDLVSNHLDVLQRVIDAQGLHDEFDGTPATYPFFSDPAQAAWDRQALRRLVAAGRSYSLVHSPDSFAGQDSVFCAFIPPGASEDVIGQVVEERLLAVVDGQHQYSGMVIGPKDVLAGTHRVGERIRSELTRQGMLRIIALLPEGLYPNHGKEQLALWVLERPVQRPTPNAPVFIGDLGGVPKQQGLHALLTDVLSALEFSRSRAYAHLTTQSVSAVSGSRAINFHSTSRDGSANNVIATASQHNDPALNAVVLQQSLDSLTASGEITAFEAAVVPTLSGKPKAYQPLVSLTQARAQGLIAVKAGHRIEHEWTKAAVPGDTSARVLDKALLMDLVTNPSRLPHQFGSRAIDALTLGQLESVELTKPGDVVFFQHKNAKAVWIDPDGGHVASHPLRVVRPRNGRAVSRFLAQDMSGYQVHASDWRKWQVRVLPDSHALSVSDVLTDVAQARQELFARLHALDQFERVLGDVMSRGGVRVERRL